MDNRISSSVERIPQGLYHTLIRPFPWEGGRSNPALLAAGLEFPLWIALYGLSGYSVWSQRKKWRPIAFPVLIVAGIALSGAMSHGNLGTAFRHRGQMLFAFAILAMGAVQAIADRRTGRTNTETATAPCVPEPSAGSGV